MTIPAYMCLLSQEKSPAPWLPEAMEGKSKELISSV